MWDQARLFKLVSSLQRWRLQWCNSGQLASLVNCSQKFSLHQIWSSHFNLWPVFLVFDQTYYVSPAPSPRWTPWGPGGRVGSSQSHTYLMLNECGSCSVCSEDKWSSPTSQDALPWTWLSWWAQRWGQHSACGLLWSILIFVPEVSLTKPVLESETSTSKTELI